MNRFSETASSNGALNFAPAECNATALIHFFNNANKAHYEQGMGFVLIQNVTVSIYNRLESR